MTVRQIGGHEVVRELGRGGMGVVYEVRDPRGRRLALKLIMQSAEGEALTRFRREAEVMARVSHANVVAVHAFDVAPEGPFIVTDLVDGQGLAELTRAGPLAPDVAATLVRALADAIAALHAHGVVHRDLKPQNVIVRPDGTPVLLDFGIARDLRSKERLTVTGTYIGTPAYMAPEQAEGASPSALGPAVDVYGLGALLLETLTGLPPFDDSEGPFAAIKRVLLEEPRWPSTLRSNTPHALEAICRLAMSKLATDRYASAAALRDDLDRYLRGEPPLALARFPAPRSPVLLMIGVGVAALALAVGAVALVLAAAREPTAPAVVTPTSEVAVVATAAPKPGRSLARLVREGSPTRAILSLPGAGLTRARFVVGGRALTFSEDGTVVLWMLEDPPRELARRTLQDTPVAAVVDGGQVFVRAWSKVLRLDDTLATQASRVVATPERGPFTYNQGLALSHDVVIAPGTRVERLDRVSLEPRPPLPADDELLELHTAAAVGELVVVGGGLTSERAKDKAGKGDLRFWRGDEPLPRDDLRSAVTCVAISPTEPLQVACGMFSGYLFLGVPGAMRDLGTFDGLVTRAHAVELTLEAVTFSPDGALLLSVAARRQSQQAISRGELWAWSVPEGNKRWVLDRCELPLSADCMVIEGRLVLLVGTARGSAELWLAPER